MSDLTEREILPMADEEIAKLKAAVTARWDDKPHYVTISPGCMMRAAEILSLIKAYEDMKADYLRRHNDAADRWMEVQTFTAALAEAIDKALEEAAKVADDASKEWASDAEQLHKDGLLKTAASSLLQSEGAKKVATAIRALKEKP